MKTKLIALAMIMIIAGCARPESYDHVQEPQKTIDLHALPTLEPLPDLYALPTLPPPMTVDQVHVDDGRMRVDFDYPASGLRYRITYGMTSDESQVWHACSDGPDPISQLPSVVQWHIRQFCAGR